MKVRVICKRLKVGGAQSTLGPVIIVGCQKRISRDLRKKDKHVITEEKQ
jgi:hypothetical protein